MYVGFLEKIMRGKLVPGSRHFCPLGHTHSLINDGVEYLEFFAVVPNQ